jgi:hypothetical protein
MTLLNKNKESLIKYCFFNDTIDGQKQRELTIQLIKETDNSYVIDFMWLFFDKFIHTYFQINRTKFNKIRYYFMQQVLMTLLSLKQHRLPTSDFYTYYDLWFDLSKMNECRACVKVKEQLEPLLKLGESYMIEQIETMRRMQNSTC